MTAHSTTVQHDLDLHESLRKRGYRLTEQRLAILNILRGCTGPQTADSIYQQAREINANLNLATVYRTLTVFREMGLVDQSYASPEHHEACFSLALPAEFGSDTNSGETSRTDESQEEVSPQKRFHFRCLGCGQTIQFQSAAIVEALTSTLSASNVQFDQICMCVQGYCPQCTQKAS